MNKPVLTLRAHHGLCLAFFAGNGYSPAFTERITEIQALLRCAPNTLIQLRRETDEVCGACPHNRYGECNSPQKVLCFDQKVMELCGVVPGQTLSWAEFSHLVAQCILEPGRRLEVCGSCEWSSLCEKAARSDFFANQKSFQSI